LVNKFGPHYARRLRLRHQEFGGTFFVDEFVVKILGDQHYLWRDLDQDGEVVDVLLHSRRDGWAARRFFKRLIKKFRGEPQDKCNVGSDLHNSLRNSDAIPTGDGIQEGLLTPLPKYRA
jgi:transposase-like protein